MAETGSKCTQKRAKILQEYASINENSRGQKNLHNAYFWRENNWLIKKIKESCLTEDQQHIQVHSSSIRPKRGMKKDTRFGMCPSWRVAWADKRRKKAETVPMIKMFCYALWWLLIGVGGKHMAGYELRAIKPSRMATWGAKSKLCSLSEMLKIWPKLRWYSWL